MADEIKGFTLIEVIVVMVIVGIVVVLALVNIEWFQRDVKLTQMRDQLLADLEYAKRMSIAQAPHGLFLYSNKYEARLLTDADGNFIRGASEATTVFPGTCDGSPSTTCTSAAGCPSGQSCVGSYPLPTSMVLTWDTCSGNLELWFDRKGIPRCNNWTVGSGILTLTRSGQTKAISINSTGKMVYTYE